VSWDGICAFLDPDHRKRRSQSSRRLITLISVGWVPPDLPPSGACLGLKCVLKISTIIFQLRQDRLCWLSPTRAAKRAYRRRLKAGETGSMLLVKRTPMVLKLTAAT
jgi:hypothetical protein